MAQNNGNNISQNLSTIETELGHLSERLLSQFHDTLTLASLQLAPEEIVTWAKEGLTLARYFPPLSVETAVEYFQVTPKVLNILAFPHFLNWVHRGEILCRHHPTIATAYFQASPRALVMLPHKLIEVWAEIGRNLHRDTPESTVLACSFFASTPALLPSLSLANMERLAIFLNRLAETSCDLATDCLNSAPQALAKIERKEQGAFLALASALARTNPEGSTDYFKRGAEVLAMIDGGQRKRFLSLMEKIARDSTRRALAFFSACSQTFPKIDRSLHFHLLHWSETVLAISATAAIDSIENCPTLLTKIRISELERWFEEGVRILRQDQAAGLAYFRLQSMDKRFLERLSARVELEQVSQILLMYCQALAGTKVQIRSNEGLKESGMGWIHPDRPTTDGTIIFVPRFMDRYNSEEENFVWYKVAVTHQAGHIEFGTFDFSFEKESSLFPNQRQPLSSTDPASLTDLERFFNLFDDRKLATDIFTMIEDVRVDYLLKQEYAGLRNGYRQMHQESLSRRPPFSSLPLREAFLENLIRISLDGESGTIPLSLRSRLQSAVQTLRCLQSPAATVEDSAEASLRLYQLISPIPNNLPPARRLDTADLAETELTAGDNSPARQDWQDAATEPGADLPYHAPAEVEFRGSFNPEQVQLLLKLKEDTHHSELSSMPLSPELLKKLAGKEIQLSGILRGDHPLSGLYTTDLPTTAQAQAIPHDKPDKNRGKLKVTELVGETSGDEEGQVFLYDEWDFQACCYLPRWCRVTEKPLAEGSTDFFTETLARNSGLAAHIRKQFEMLSPQRLNKLNKLDDGEELDLNAAVEAIVDRKAGHSPDDKIYLKRRRIQRDVAVIFLLDMSSSTAEVINGTDDEEDYFDWYFDRIEVESRFRAQRAERTHQAPRRVIDVTKESVVLMIHALETIGDCYGIYGFSGHGRENVELLVIKGIDEKFSSTVSKRIDKITPLRGTRMGPAIRHAIAKLETCEAKTKILFLVSDGYPQDKGYGRDSNDREYALRDTKMALIEAKRKNITPFCLTIDIAGHDYLKKMAHDLDYEVVNNIEALPQRLLTLYKRLTS